MVVIFSNHSSLGLPDSQLMQLFALSEVSVAANHPDQHQAWPWAKLSEDKAELLRVPREGSTCKKVALALLTQPFKPLRQLETEIVSFVLVTCTTTRGCKLPSDKEWLLKDDLIGLMSIIAIKVSSYWVSFQLLQMLCRSSLSAHYFCVTSNKPWLSSAGGSLEERGSLFTWACRDKDKGEWL